MVVILIMIYILKFFFILIVFVKLNLFLYINGCCDDGYYEFEILFIFLEFGDDLIFIVIYEFDIIVIGDINGIVLIDNFIYKVVCLL